MNVNNFQAPEQMPEDMLRDIFEHQHKLATKYLDIEEKNGLLQTRDLPVNINDPKGQARIKDMFWRTTEEIAEAMEALWVDDYTHFYEELADAMHFLVEACLLADYVPYKRDMSISYPASYDSLTDMFQNIPIYQPKDSSNIEWNNVQHWLAEFVVAAGLTCNCLKNKPWKSTHMLTDEGKFNDRLREAFIIFIKLCKVSGFSAQGLYMMYMRKNQVNQFRQRSGY